MAEHRNGPAGHGAASKSSWRDRAQSSEPVGPLHEGPTLLDHLDGIEEGRRRRDDGMRTAQLGEAFGIVTAIEAEVRRLAATGQPFLPDDCLPTLASRRAVGPVFSRLAKEGVIEVVGVATATRPERHGALTRVYQGTGAA